VKPLALFLISASLAAQSTGTANEHYKTERQRSDLARSLEGSDRDAKQRPRELVVAIGVKPGMTVADVGTGPGYMLPFLSEAVGPQGKVYAEDVFPDFLAKARTNATRHNLNNVEFVQGNASDPKLPSRSLDVILLLDVYHHLDNAPKLLAALREAFKSNGHLAIVEYHRNDKSMGAGRAQSHIRLGADEAIKEIEQNGFRLEKREDFNPEVQWLATFVPAR
jgi:predicted methyltransferase